MANNHSIPDTISFSPKDVKAAAKRKQLAPTGKNRRIKFVVGDTRKSVADTGTMMIQLTCHPLKDPDDKDSRTSPTVRHSLMVPLANENVEGHKAPNTTGLCHGYYRAVDPENMPDYPRKVDGTLSYEGEEILKEEEEEKREEVTEKIMERIVEDWGDPARLTNDVFFAEVIENNGYPNLRNLSESLPDGCTIVPPEEFTGVAEEEEEEKPAPKKGAAKAPAKGGKKK